MTDVAVSGKYKMTISRLTVDKLGVKLYDKVSAVLAELIANSYDADATEVLVYAPMGEFLAGKERDDMGNLKDNDKGYKIEIWDNGIGMTPDQINDFYLRVGAERRTDPRRGARSKIYKRKVMGRKGVGKLAPFGICERIEILTSGGEEISEIDANGNTIKGYRTAHLFLDRVKILTNDDSEYNPEVGLKDGTLRRESGTELTLTIFNRRQVPTMADLARQLSQRFGIRSSDWRIHLVDSLNDQNIFDVTDFEVAKMELTEFTFKAEQQPGGIYNSIVIDPTGKVLTDIEAGFVSDEVFYPINGWIAYSETPYKDGLMAGVRIYCNKKIAAQTNIFNRKAGFTGEQTIRSYLVGELHADWLDEQEDLIQTDRRDILWSHDLGQKFEEWGQRIVLRLGTVSRNPLKKKAWDLFKEISQIEQRVNQAFPGDDQKPLRENAMELAKLMGQTMRESELQTESDVKPIVDLSLTLAPHIVLDRKLKEAAESDSPLEVITGILNTARIAELSSYGQIAENRVKVIDKVEEYKDDGDTLEEVFQRLIQEAPWLIDPQWSPISANQSFSTLKTEFEKYYLERTGEKLMLGDPIYPTKRADFVLSSQDNVIQIIEIKRPKHTFEDDEMDRLYRYAEQMHSFLTLPNNKAFTTFFNGYHITLVCDNEKLSGVHKAAFQGLIDSKSLTYINWTTFLVRTKKMHEAFLSESDRQKRIASQRK